MTTRFSIPAWNKEKFEKAINRFVNKGLDIGHKVIGTETININGLDFLCDIHEIDTSRVYQEEGWALVGKVIPGEDNNFVINVTGEDIPERFFTDNITCEHCYKAIARKESFLVKNLTTGDYLQVGSSCLKAYTGLIPAVAINALSIEESLRKMENVDESSLPEKAYFHLGYKVNDIIALSIHCIKEYGFRPSGYEESTKERVYNLYQSTIGNRIVEEVMATPIFGNFLYWALDVEADSNFMINAKNAIKSQYGPKIVLGLVPAMVNTYFKHLKDLDRANSKIDLGVEGIEYNDSYIGETGTKIEVEIVKSEVLYVMSPYTYGASSSNLTRLIDSDGHVLIWTTTQEVPEQCKIKATIKTQREYNGIKETVITRGKILSN